MAADKSLGLSNTWTLNSRRLLPAFILSRSAGSGDGGGWQNSETGQSDVGVASMHDVVGKAFGTDVRNIRNTLHQCMMLWEKPLERMTLHQCMMLWEKPLERMLGIYGIRTSKTRSSQRGNGRGQ